MRDPNSTKDPIDRDAILYQNGFNKGMEHRHPSPETAKRLDKIEALMNNHILIQTKDFQEFKDIQTQNVNTLQRIEVIVTPLAEDYRAIIKMGKWIAGGVGFAAILVGIYKALWK